MHNPALKRRLNDLAFFGGAPSFPAPLHVGRPNLGDQKRFLQRTQDILDRRWLTNDGPVVREFESRLAETCGAEHVVCVANATIGLQMALRALARPGRILMPSFTFVGTAHAAEWQGMTPRFCDVAPLSHHIDPAALERQITSEATAILAVHLWGMPCDHTALAAISARHRLPLIYDSAHALGCSFGDAPIGSLGDAEVFSFHGTKVVNSFEGGAITTNHAGLAEELRSMRNFGFSGYDRTIGVGTNAKMSEISAAMGLTNLEAFPEFVATNRRNHEAYQDGLAQLPGLALLDYAGPHQNNYQYAIVEIDEAVTGISRDALVEILHAENVLARRYFHPGCHRMEPYAARPESLPHTEEMCRRVMALPTGTAVGAEEIGGILSILATVLESTDTGRLARSVAELSPVSAPVA